MKQNFTVVSDSFAAPWAVGSSVHGISLVRILEWVAVSFSRGSSRPCTLCIGRWILYRWATRDVPCRVESSVGSASTVGLSIFMNCNQARHFLRARGAQVASFYLFYLSFSRLDLFCASFKRTPSVS